MKNARVKRLYTKRTKQGSRMKYITLSILAMMLTACTYSINMVHSNGTATDVIDETDTPTATTSVEVPVKAI